MNNKDILEKVKRIVEAGEIKDRKIVEDVIRYEFKKRRIGVREKEKNNKLSINSVVMTFLKDLSSYKKTSIKEHMANAMINTKLPIAEGQYKIGTKIVDFAFPKQKLVVECDGYKWHRYDKEQIEGDIKRDAYLAKRGWRVLHFSGVQVRRNIEGCIEEIKRALFIK